MTLQAQADAIIHRAIKAVVSPSEPPLRVVCAWCPGFDPTNPVNEGATHGMCPSCAKRWTEEGA